MLALIDGDILRYRIGFACEKKEIKVYPKGDEDKGVLATFTSKTEYNKWIKVADPFITEDDITVETLVKVDPLENCLHSVKVQIEAILEATAAAEYKIYLTGAGNFRDTLVDYYKANRDRSKRPAYYEDITGYLIRVHGAEVIHGMEADDALSIEQHRWLGPSSSAKDYSSVICTIDKDLDMVPGWHYNFVKQKKYYIGEDEGIRNFYCQLLQGDAADNIPGYGKITGSKAKKWDDMLLPLAFIDSEKEMYDYVSTVYLEALAPDGTSDKDILGARVAIDTKLTETGKLLWMKRTPDDEWVPPL